MKKSKGSLGKDMVFRRAPLLLYASIHPWFVPVKGGLDKKSGAAKAVFLQNNG
jgi:hypothetical protein